MGDEQAYDLETLLLQIREIVDTARTMPMSASVLVNREETLEIVDDALRSLPEELRHARWLLKEREEYLTQARRDAGRHRRGCARPGRADGRAHRGRSRSPPRRAAGGLARGSRQPTPASRGRGLHRPEAGVVRSGPRAHPSDRASTGASSFRRSWLRCRPNPISIRSPTRTIPPFSTRTTLTGELAIRPPKSSGCYPQRPAPGLLGAAPRTVAPSPQRAGGSGRPFLTKR